MNAILEKAAAHFGNGDAAKAYQLVNDALTKDPLNGEAWHMRGVIALHTSRPAEAVDDLTRAASLRPQDTAVHINLGAALNTVLKYDQAAHVLKKALTLDPRSPEAHYQMSVSLMQRARPQEALAELARAVKLRPNWIAALEIQAHLLFHTGEHQKAHDVATQALALDPNRAVPHRVIADCYTRWLRYDEALQHYRRALALSPNDDSIHANYGLLLMRLGRDEEAVAEYAIAYRANPTMSQVREGYGFALLGLGRFAEGWLHYAARDKAHDSAFAVRPGAQPPSDISQLSGNPVLAWLNQGIGDQILFSSLIPDLIAAGAQLTVECDPRLVPVLRRSFPSISARPAGGPLPAPGDEAFAYQVFLPDTARWCRTTFGDFPRHRGYLKADETRTDALRHTYRAERSERPVIGIAWRTASNAKISHQKTLGLKEWGPILRNRDATFVKLQYGDLKQEVAEAREALGVTIIDDASVDAIADIDAFAAQVAAMDLVITTSNATAHMAGSLNVPVWTLLPKGYGGMWHWFRDRSDSPWYSSMRLFRQSERTDWRPVLEEVSAALTEFLATWKA